MVKIETKPISLTVVLRNVAEAYGQNLKLTYRMVAEFLTEKGVLVENPSGNPRQKAADGMKNRGIWSEMVMDTNGEHLMTYYDAQGQKLVFDLLKDFKAK